MPSGVGFSFLSWQTADQAASGIRRTAPRQKKPALSCQNRFADQTPSGTRCTAPRRKKSYRFAKTGEPEARRRLLLFDSKTFSSKKKKKF